MSSKITKINIDVEQYNLIKILAAAKGISATKMLEHIIVEYISNNSYK